MKLESLSPFISSHAYSVLDKADKRCQGLLKVSAEFLSDYLKKASINFQDVCFAVTGSVGRYEALEASDFDLTPIACSASVQEDLLKDNESLRSGLAAALTVDVSRGRDLTKTVTLSELSDTQKIGGEYDGRTSLTQRILVLTESAQAGGGLSLDTVRKKILDAYASERTAGRHPLAFCNDLARYYRTVCIDYKARVDTTAKDWCTRNVKLRHSRKFWYFATLLGVASIVKTIRPDAPQFVEELLKILSLPPYQRLFRSLGTEAQAAAGRLLDQYAWYLDFMADPERRGILSQVTHERRYEVGGSNPYPTLQWNSKVMHSAMVAVLERVGPEVHERVLDWFLL